MDVGHSYSGSSGSSPVYSDHLSAITGLLILPLILATGNRVFFQSQNPRIKPRQSRDFGIGKMGRDCNP